MGKIALYYRTIRSFHIGKDVTVVPQYLGRTLGLDVEIVSNADERTKEIPEVVDGMRFRLLKGTGPYGDAARSFRLYLHLCRHAREYDVVVFIHYHMRPLLGVLLYKLFNPKGIAYIKGDFNESDLSSGFSRGRGVRGFFRRLFYRTAIKHLDILSCETSRTYSRIRTSDSPLLSFRDGQLVLAPNGFDEAAMIRTGTARRSWDEKENIILMVGRLGFYEKNCEMLLDALENLDLGGWKCLFVGKRTPEFDERARLFKQAHPDKAGSVVLPGFISDKKTLWDLFSRARVFVLTSRYESAGLVLNEAKWFGCYILTTDVGTASDLLSGKPFGEFLPQDDPKALAAALERIISGETSTDVYDGYDYSELSLERCMLPVVEKISGLLNKA